MLQSYPASGARQDGRTSSRQPGKCTPQRRRVLQFGSLLAVALVLGLMPAEAFCQWPQITCVEEDWEAVIATPDTTTTAPQITTVMAPVNNLDSKYATFEINHRSYPTFISGGLHMLLWDIDQVLANNKFPNAEALSSTGETVRWTQQMRLQGGNLSFEVRNGTSTTWGNFGGQGYLRASVASSLNNLNGYSWAVSTQNSGVSFAGNRVQSLQIKQIRYYTDQGLIYTDNNVKSVD